MQKEFWLERWQQNQIGFHQEEVNKALQAFASELKIGPGDLVWTSAITFAASSGR